MARVTAQPDGRKSAVATLARSTGAFGSRILTRILIAAASCVVFAAAAAAADTPVPEAARTAIAPIPELSAEQIVAKNVEARGGLEAWRRIQTMVWVGHLESPRSPEPQMSFFLEQKRPNKTHFEIDSMGQKSMRIFDGVRGWRARPGKNGVSNDVQPFTPQEVKFARDAQGIDGPLIDYQTRGSTVALAGIDEIEGRKTYHISVRLASGERNEVWVDAQNFLDIRFDRTSYSGNGEAGTVSIFYRDYKSVEGLQMPAVMEIGVGSAKAPDRMIIEKVALNPPLDEKTFARPGGMKRKGPAIVDIQPTPGAFPSTPEQR